MIKVIWGGRWDELLRKDTSGKLIQLMNETVDGDYQTFKSRDGAYVAITGNRAIQTLQVTVDDEDQVIQFFTGRDGDRAFRFWLIHLTVTQEGVNGLSRGIFQATVFQILQELRLVDSRQRTQTH